MKKYQLTGQPIYVGETYNHNGDLYRVESFDEGYTEPKVTLRRIKDGNASRRRPISRPSPRS